MKSRYLFLTIGLLLLQACQQLNETQETMIGNQYNRSEAASYNAQLGLAYLKQNNRIRAKRKLLNALVQDPNSPNVNAAMAYFLEKTGQYQQAQLYYLKAISLAPEKGAQINNYGAFLCRRGKMQQAEKYFLQAAQDLHYENTASVYENAGLCALSIPDTAKAKHYFLKALEQDPARKQSLYELVILQVKQQQIGEALDNLQKYQDFLSSDKELLSLAVEVAHQAGNNKLENLYKKELYQTMLN